MHEYSDLRIILHHFRAKEVGKTKNPNGTWSRITVGENIFETKIGMIPEDEWEKLAEHTIKDHHDEKLFDAVEDHVRNHCAWLHKDPEIRQYALSCMMSESWKAWKDRGEFNYKEDKTLRFDIEKLKEEMKAYGDTNAQLADALGVSRQSVSQVMNGKHDFTYPQLIVIAARYNLSAERFFKIFIAPTFGEHY